MIAVWLLSFLLCRTGKGIVGRQQRNGADRQQTEGQRQGCGAACQGGGGLGKAEKNRLCLGEESAQKPPYRQIPSNRAPSVYQPPEEHLSRPDRDALRRKAGQHLGNHRKPGKGEEKHRRQLSQKPRKGRGLLTALCHLQEAQGQEGVFPPPGGNGLQPSGEAGKEDDKGA